MRSILLIIFSIIVLTSCREVNTQTEFDKKLEDSLFTKRNAEMRKVLDSICTIQTDSMVNSYVDSIKVLRFEEIEKILK